MGSGHHKTSYKILLPKSMNDFYQQGRELLSRALAKCLLPMATTLRTLQALSNTLINVPGAPLGFQALCYHKS